MSGLIYTVHVVGDDGVTTTAFGPDSTEIPPWALEKIGDHAFEDGQRPASETAVPYEKWKKADLEAEVESRNEGRPDEDLVVVEGKGTVADLVAALEADDQLASDQA